MSSSTESNSRKVWSSTRESVWLHTGAAIVGIVELDIFWSACHQSLPVPLTLEGRNTVYVNGIRKRPNLYYDGTITTQTRSLLYS